MSIDTKVLAAWKAAGRDIDVKVTVGNTVYDKESVVSCDISLDGSLLKSNMKMLTLQLTGVEDIGSDHIDDISIGVYSGGEYNYASWGDFYIDYSDDSTIYDECTDVLTLIAYDGMYKLMQPISGEIDEVQPALLHGRIPARHTTSSVDDLYLILSADVPVIIQTLTDDSGTHYYLNRNGVNLGTRRDETHSEINSIVIGYNKVDLFTYRDIIDRLCEMYGVGAYYKRESSGTPSIILLPAMANSQTGISTMIPATENSFETDYCSSFKSKKSQKVTAVKLKGSNNSITVTHPSVENNGVTIVFENDVIKELVDRLTKSSGNLSINEYCYNKINTPLTDEKVLAASYQRHIIGYEVKSFDAVTYGLPWCAYMPPLLRITDSKTRSFNAICTNVNLKIAQGMTESFAFSGFENVEQEESFHTDTEQSVSVLEYTASASSDDTDSSITVKDNHDYMECSVNIFQNGNAKMLRLDVLGVKNFYIGDNRYAVTDADYLLYSFGERSYYKKNDGAALACIVCNQDGWVFPLLCSKNKESVFWYTAGDYSGIYDTENQITVNDETWYYTTNAMAYQGTVDSEEIKSNIPEFHTVYSDITDAVQELIFKYTQKMTIAENLPIPVQEVKCPCHGFYGFDGHVILDGAGTLYLTGNKQLTAGEQITCCFLYL